MIPTDVMASAKIYKMHANPLHPQLDGMVEQLVKTMEEYLRNIILTHQRDSDKGLPLFLLAYRAMTHETTA
jgi:hypothetical protein